MQNLKYYFVFGILLTAFITTTAMQKYPSNIPTLQELADMERAEMHQVLASLPEHERKCIVAEVNKQKLAALEEFYKHLAPLESIESLSKRTQELEAQPTPFKRIAEESQQKQSSLDYLWNNCSIQ